MGNGTDEKEDKVDLAKITRRLIEIFQIKCSLTSEELEERRELQERSGTFLALGRALTHEETRDHAKIQERLLDFLVIEDGGGRKLSDEYNELEVERLELTAILLEIRLRPARQASPPHDEEDEVNTEARKRPSISKAEAIAANKGVFNVTGAAWKGRTN